MQTITELMKLWHELNVKVHSRASSGHMKLKKLSPPSFEGSTYPLKEIEKAFIVLKSTNEEKVVYATYML